MSAASSLTTYNSELVKALEDLREQREEVNRSILRDEEEKARIQKARSTLSFSAPRAPSPGDDGAVHCCLVARWLYALGGWGCRS